MREFNRFYFHRMRPLKVAMTDFGFHPSELRVIREIGEAPQGVSASYMAWKLHMEQARVSRILSFFKALGWTTEEKDPRDGRIKTIRLSPAGSETYGRLDRQAAAWAELMLRLVAPQDRDCLIHAMAEIQRILGTVRI